ncbi:MAG: LysR family transcriptional regulator [Nitrospinota bacterium]|nr:LysR family transcriptional regulator [Nitrospinota bacterium]
MPGPKPSKTTCRPRIRIKTGAEIALGPGKVDLLEAIERTGSISAGARELGLSYRRAWDLVDTMNHCFKHPLVARIKGGKGGGGAQLTDEGREMLDLYRKMEIKALKAIDPEWKSVQKSLKSPPGK